MKKKCINKLEKTDFFYVVCYCIDKGRIRLFVDTIFFSST